MAKTVGIGSRLAALDGSDVLLELVDELLDVVATVAVELGAIPRDVASFLEEALESPPIVSLIVTF